MPTWDNQDIEDIEQDRPFVTYAWQPPVCPWCGNWLREVNLSRFGFPVAAATGCPYYHGFLAFGQTKWVHLRPPPVERGCDGVWYSTTSIEELLVLSQIS